MKRFVPDRVIGAGFAVAGLAAVGLLVLITGIYSVAASRGHFKIVAFFLEVGMRRSVALHSNFVPKPERSLDDTDLIRLGAGHYFRGCAFCHGGPGATQSPITQTMLPAPPNLSQHAATWTDRELFWIVQNGLKYTGMPGWPALQRHDEIWAVIAFLRRLPELSSEEYIALAHGNTKPPRNQSQPTDTFARAIANCARCHGDKGVAPASDLVPVIAGQKVEYLAQAIEYYAAGVRASGIMQPLAAELDGELRLRVAQYFANLSPNGKAAPPQAANELGASIALKGIAERGIPACVSCHTGPTAGTFPRLSGQSAAYLTQQLKLWKRDLRDRSAQGAIMAVVARRLTDAEAESVAAYFASRDPPEDKGATR